MLVYIIRAFGGYPDGVAFAVLLMNIAAPTIDLYTQPRVFERRVDETIARSMGIAALILTGFAVVGTGWSP